MGWRSAVCVAVALASMGMQSKPVKVGAPVSLRYKTVDGLTGKSEGLRGKLVVVVFFSPGEEGTAEALRAVQEQMDALEGSGVSAIGVCASKSEDDLRGVIKSFNLSFPVHFDAKQGAVGVMRGWKVKKTPAIFLLDPDGRQVFSGGAAELAGRVRDQLKLTPPRMISRRTMAAAMDGLELAEARLNAGKPRSAARFLAALPADAALDGDVAERLAALTRSLEQALPELIAETEKLAEQDMLAEAVVLLEQAAAALKNTPGEEAALAQLHTFTDDPELKPKIEAGRPQALGADMLASAGEFEESGDVVEAYRLCVKVIETYPATKAATQARERVAAWEAVPERKRALRDALYGEKARALLSQAQSYRRSNLTEKARGFLDELIAKYPGTTAAEAAALMLKEMK